jgi:hypothetical protein
MHVDPSAGRVTDRTFESPLWELPNTGTVRANLVCGKSAHSFSLAAAQLFRFQQSSGKQTNFGTLHLGCLFRT